MKRLHTLAILAAIIVMASCSSSDEAVFTSADDVLERIDMIIDANDDEHIFAQSTQAETHTDLVDFARLSHADKVEFILNIDESRTLTFSVTDQLNAEVWTRIGEGYTLYNAQDMDDKQSWVTAAMKTNGGEILSASHIGNEYPRGTYINAFRIVEFNPANNEILCRIEGFPMVKLNNYEDMTINGTFRGTISF